MRALECIYLTSNRLLWSVDHIVCAPQLAIYCLQAFYIGSLDKPVYLIGKSQLIA